MLLLTQRLTSITDVVPDLTLSLTAEERTRSRYRLTTPEGEEIGLHLPRGTVLQEGDLLTSEDGKTIVRIVARSEPTILVTATHSLDLLRAAYHLGNRHVPLEITPNYLHLSPDPVLESMLIKLGLVIREEIAPFHPEIGAYHGH
jgi:urease accessory protein